VEAANHLLNRLRDSLDSIEKENSISITVIADPSLPPGELVLDSGQPDAGTTVEAKGESSGKARKRPRRKKKKPAVGGTEVSASATGAPKTHESRDDSARDDEKPSASKKRRARRRRSAKKKASASSQGVPDL